MRVLSIGNSFSQDATWYLHRIAEAGGKEIDTWNLYIGGCSLYRHAKNLRGALKEYSLEINGQGTAEAVSINDMIAKGGWDAVTLQQASHYSGLPETYDPFLEEIASVLREALPEAKLYIHETWSYDPDSVQDGFPIYSMSSEKMYNMLSSAYRSAAEKIGAGFLPVGDGIEELRKTALFMPRTGSYSVNRDGFHLSIPYGRMFAAYIWCECLLDLDVRGNAFRPAFGRGECDPEAVKILQETAHRTAKGAL